MIQSIIFLDSKKVKNITSAQLTDVKGKFVWIDVENPTADDFTFLKKHFSLHPLACDTVFDSSLRPKLVEFDKHLLIVFHEPDPEDHGLNFNRIDLFVGENFLITSHKESVAAIDAVKETLDSNPGIMKNGPAFLTHNILDNVAESYFPVLDAIDSSTDELEDRIFSKNDNVSLREIFSLKKQILELRKKIGPEREVLTMLSRHELSFIDKNSIIYFRDVYDHLIRISEMLEIYRDLLTGILEVYVSVQSNKLNEVMKVLTVIATILLPLTFITGFYGMNVVFPEVEYFGLNSYFFIFFLMALLVVVMIFYFKKRKWL